MTKHFIKYIEIRAFKCFDSFRTEGFKRVNLISGENNVGKTELMEAIYINAYSKDVKSCFAALYEISPMKENINILAGSTEDNIENFIDLNNGIFSKSNINQVLYKISNNKENCNELSLDIKEIHNINFISHVGLLDVDIVENYSSIQKREKEASSDRIINSFDPRIEHFKIINNVPSCKVNGKYLKLMNLDDKVKHLVSIITSLHASENGYLFIDEIGCDPDCSQIDSIWEIILKVSKELNFQVFATSQSKSCIESYGRVVKKLKDEDITFIELKKKDALLRATVYPYNLFIDEVD